MLLLPCRSLAFALVVLGAVALAAIWSSGLGLLLKSVLSLILLVGLVHGCLRFLRPQLQLRLHEDQLEYRVGSDGAWRRQPARRACFASPWFIGWRGEALRSHGVFRVQLPREQFRKLLVALRHLGPT